MHEALHDGLGAHIADQEAATQPKELVASRAETSPASSRHTAPSAAPTSLPQLDTRARTNDARCDDDDRRMN